MNSMRLALSHRAVRQLRSRTSSILLASPLIDTVILSTCTRPRPRNFFTACIGYDAVKLLTNRRLVALEIEPATNGSVPADLKDEQRVPSDLHVGWKRIVDEVDLAAYSKSPFSNELIEALLQRAKDFRLYRRGSRNEQFTPETDRSLLITISDTIRDLSKGVDEFNDLDWKSIAARTVGRHKTDHVKRRWDHLRPNSKFGYWSPEEDELLRNAVMKHGENWRLVAQEVPNRSKKQCFERYRWTAQPGIIAGPYSPEEDQIILTTLEGLMPDQIDYKKWREVTALLPGRTSLSIKHRYERSLMPTLRSGPFSEEEQQMVILLVEEYGEGSWTKISAEMGYTRSAKALYARTFLLILSPLDLRLAEGVARAKLSQRGQWRDVAEFVGNSLSVDQCMARWKVLMRYAPDVDEDAVDIKLKVADLTSFGQVLADCAWLAEEYHKRVTLQLQALRERRSALSLATQDVRMHRRMERLADDTVQRYVGRLRRLHEFRGRILAKKEVNESYKAKHIINRLHNRLLTKQKQLSRPERVLSVKKAKRHVDDKQIGLERNIRILSEKLSNTEPRSQDAYYYLINRGLSYEKCGNLKAALDDYTAASQINGDVQAALYRAQVRKQLGDYDAGLEAVHDALRHSPTDTRLLAALKDIEEAKAKKKAIMDVNESLAAINREPEKEEIRVTWTG